MISLVGLNKADVLAVLYNASKPQGMGFLQYDPKPMTRAEAEELLKSDTYFDYLKGRVMKVDLEKDEFNPWGYDRDNGEGAAAAAITSLSTENTNAPEIQEKHRISTIDSAADVMGRLDEKSEIKKIGDTDVFHLGLDDVAHVLEPAVQKAVEGK
jgi:hypothetical protein